MSTITRGCRTHLKEACDGKRIDLDHPVVVAYLEKRGSIPPPRIGIDAYYERAVALCAETQKFTLRHLMKHLNIGEARAERILNTMAANGINGPASPKLNPVPLTVASSPKKRSDLQEEETKILEVPDEIREFLNFTVGDIVEKFGTLTRFKDWLAATQTIEAINEKRLKNAKFQGELVSRELVEKYLIAPFDGVHKKILTDGARKIAVRAYAMVNADAEVADIEKYIKKEITSFLRPVKEKIAKALENV